MIEYIDRDALLRKLEQRMDWQDTYLPIHFKEWVIDETPTYALKEMQMVRWIPVTERYPREKGLYLVIANFEHEKKPIISIQKYEPECESFGEWEDGFDPLTMWYIGSEFVQVDVTHWMPLPNLPEEVKSDE